MLHDTPYYIYTPCYTCTDDYTPLTLTLTLTLALTLTYTFALTPTRSSTARPSSGRDAAPTSSGTSSGRCLLILAQAPALVLALALTRPLALALTLTRWALPAAEAHDGSFRVQLRGSDAAHGESLCVAAPSAAALAPAGSGE